MERGAFHRLSTFVCSISIQTLGLSAGFLCLHTILSYLQRTLPVALGGLTPDYVVPLFAHINVHLSLWLIPACCVFIGFFLVIPRGFLDPQTSVPHVLCVAAAFFFAIGTSVAMIDGYHQIDGDLVPAILVPYTRTASEYYADVPLVDTLGLQTFLRDYPIPSVFSELSLHAKTHPPGGVMFLWLVSQLFGYTLISATACSIAFTSSRRCMHAARQSVGFLLGGRTVMSPVAFV